jgi:hypothetical protein
LKLALPLKLAVGVKVMGWPTPLWLTVPPVPVPTSSTQPGTTVVPSGSESLPTRVVRFTEIGRCLRSLRQGLWVGGRGEVADGHGDR